MLKILLPMFFLFAAVAQAGGFETSCIGPADARNFAVYLHGMDTPIPSQQELSNRAILSDLATRQGIRIALPRAPGRCPTQPGFVCWGWSFDRTELAAVLPAIINSRSNCFPTDKPFQMIGFSNGGYLLTHWYTAGMSPAVDIRPTALVASGSAVGQVPAGQALEQNPRLSLVIGNEDQFNSDPNQSLFHSLQRAGANVRLLEFRGGHALDEASLAEAISVH